MNKILLSSLCTFFLGVILASACIMLTPLRFTNIVEPTIKEISPKNFYDLFSKNPEQYMFIDVRSEEDYLAGHAEGSINMPLESLYNQRRYLPRHGKTIALICNGTQASGVGYSFLEHHGFFNLVRVTGGVPAWKIAGLPIVTGSEPYAELQGEEPIGYAEQEQEMTVCS